MDEGPASYLNGGEEEADGNFEEMEEVVLPPGECRYDANPIADLHDCRGASGRL